MPSTKDPAPGAEFVEEDATPPPPPGLRARWVLTEGLYPLGGIGPEPMTDEEFRQLAAGFGAVNACSVEDVIANGPYVLVENYAPEEVAAVLEGAGE